MSDITELRKNIERLNRSTTATSKNQSNVLVEKSITNLESEFEAIKTELSSKVNTVEALKKENLTLKQDYNILNSRVKDLITEKVELENKLEQLSRTRPELSSVNLVKAFRDSLEQMDMSINDTSSRVDYRVSSMNVKLKANIAVQGDELRFQLPKTDDYIPASNLSEVEFTINSSSREPAFSDYVDVPDVVGLDYDVAISIIKDAGFTQGEIIEKDSDFVQGTVLSQIPSGTSLAKLGDAVDLVISKITSVAVPNIVGIDIDAARKVLAASRLNTGKITEQPDSSKPGTVISQSIAFGQMVDIGSGINIVVASPVIEFAAVSGKKEVVTNPVISGSVKDLRKISSSKQSTRVASVMKSISRQV